MTHNNLTEYFYMLYKKVIMYIGFVFQVLFFFFFTSQTHVCLLYIYYSAIDIKFLELMETWSQSYHRSLAPQKQLQTRHNHTPKPSVWLLPIYCITAGA